QKKEIDFGVLALALPSEAEMATLLAPRERAPALMPAYLDLWVQTAPVPAAIPPVHLWLHGPESGPADVQVVWRADLREEAGAAEGLVAIVDAIQPSSLEAVSLPYAAARRWLENAPPADIVADLVDVEGAPSPREDGAASRWALRWKGGASEVIDA